ncbi:hypothetical protein [Nitrospira sp. Nam74]
MRLTLSDRTFIAQLEHLAKVQVALALGLFGQPHEGNDEGVDLKMGQLWTDDMLTIGVIAQSNAKALLVETTKVQAEYYVLVSYDENLWKQALRDALPEFMSNQ